MVLGASGYAGGELVRLICGHPEIDAVCLAADSRAGAPFAAHLPHFGRDGTFASLAEGARTPADVCFSCLPSGALATFADDIAAERVVDLSGDHRDDARWVYGLTELRRDKVAGAMRIANPGCYATACLLAIAPFASAGVIKEAIVVTGLSGASGAGRFGRDDLSLAGLHGSAHAYGNLPHRHVLEVERELAQLTGFDASIAFTPHLLPMARGLIVTVHAEPSSTITDDDARAILRDAYEDEIFVDVVDVWPDAKATAGSNRAVVHARVDEHAERLVMCCAIDNLGKGAAGQALQNANVALGLDEATGLSAVGVWP